MVISNKTKSLQKSIHQSLVGVTNLTQYEFKSRYNESSLHLHQK